MSPILFFIILFTCTGVGKIFLQINPAAVTFIDILIAAWEGLISSRLFDGWTSWYNRSMWHRDWPHQVYVGQWPIFYGPVILLLIWKTIWWRNILFVIMDQCDRKIDLVKDMWVNDPYFMVHWFCLISCHTLELFLYFKNWRRPGVFTPIRALALVLYLLILCLCLTVFLSIFLCLPAYICICVCICLYICLSVCLCLFLSSVQNVDS